ncbi:MAG: sigma factor-like helix-turn-helix DNA-binding protein [Thermus sp.]
MEKSPSETLLEHLGVPRNVLTEKEAFILALRMGFVDGQEHTVEEVARLLGSPTRQIRSLEEEALRKVRAYKEGNEDRP